MKPIFPLVMLASSLLASAHALAECTTNRNVDIIITKPDSIYTDHGDGTVTDNETSLMWQKCQLGFSGNDCASTTLVTVFTWQAALVAADGNTGSGYNDWRLPNVKELESLVEDACYGPAINETVFPNTAGHHWSSSLSVGAWVVGFGSGYVPGGGGNGTSNTYYVRLVRGGI